MLYATFGTHINHIRFQFCFTKLKKNPHSPGGGVKKIVTFFCDGTVLWVLNLAYTLNPILSDGLELTISEDPVPWETEAERDWTVCFAEIYSL